MVAGIQSALHFLDKVKVVCGADSPQYQGFIDVLKDFKAERADIRETIRRIIALFQGHPELIEGFAEFLPPGNTIQIPVDPQHNILVVMPTGTMEIAQDGTVVNETHTQAPGPQAPETQLPEFAERDKRLLERIRARITDSEENKAKYEPLVTSFEAYLKMSTEQRKALLGADQGHEFVIKLSELLGDDDETKKALSEVFE